MKKKADYIIYTDGGCSFNPGGTGGIGVVIINTETGEETEKSKGYLVTTNNRMEMTAAIEGLKAIPKNSTIELYSDSQYVVHCMSGAWRRNKNRDLWNIMDKVSKDKKINLNWIRGHNGDKYNEKCDTLASRAIMFGPYQEDKGYREIKKRGKAFYEKIDSLLGRGREGAMSVNIVIPEELVVPIQRGLRPKEYEEKYNVKHSCAKAICDFYLFNKKSFKSYLSLKTGGIDKHSRKKLEVIAAESNDPALYIQTLQKYISNEKGINTAARWNSRGLSLEDSIRKVLVDAEVRDNCIRS